MKNNSESSAIEITFLSHVPFAEHTPIPPFGAQLRDKFGLIIATVVGLSLFMTPSLIIWAVTGYQAAQSSILERTGLLLWLYSHQFSLLFLMAWNAVFQVDHALRAPAKYSRVLYHVMGWSLRAIGLFGYVLVVLQVLDFGICLEV